MQRARARDLGIVVGALPAGEHNAITDVPGVRVGHTTLVEGSDIRTGVTAIVHDRLTGAQALNAGLATGNGFGKIVGTTQVSELGVIETPIVLTGTLCTFRAADALVSYMLSLPGNEELETVNPVVAETNDGFLSDMRRRPVTEEHVLAALRGATAGPVAEGAVGAGTGTGALGFKAGIGTSSRLAECGPSGGAVTLGVLVQANFSGTLTVLGVPVPPGPEQADRGAGGQDDRATDEPDERAADKRGEPAADKPGNSCVIVLATDAPLDSRRLARVAWRSFAGMARAGSDFSGRSGCRRRRRGSHTQLAAGGRDHGRLPGARPARRAAGPGPAARRGPRSPTGRRLAASTRPGVVRVTRPEPSPAPPKWYSVE
jgi:D-aminopeptidase